MTKDWSRDFFRGLVAETVPLLFPPEVTALEAAGLWRALGARPGQHLLDVPCGNGRLALALAAQGCQVTGVDLCPALVDQASTAAGSAGLPAHFLVSDMRALSLTAPFDGAWCMGNSFAYFDDEANLAFLRGVAAALKPGARFVLDSLCAETLLPHLVPRKWFRLGSIVMLSETTYDPLDAVLTTNYSLLRGEEREDKTARYRIHGVRELVELLHVAGFSAVEAWADLDGSPFRFGARRLFLLATR